MVIAILRGNEEACTQVTDLNENTKEATTYVNAFEVFYGAYRSERKIENTKEVIKLLEKLFVIPLGSRIFKKNSRVASEIGRKGADLGL